MEFIAAVYINLHRDLPHEVESVEPKYTYESISWYVTKIRFYPTPHDCHTIVTCDLPAM